MTAALELRGITAGYRETDVLRNVDLVADQGAVTALIGPNGAGKSTLLKTVSGLIHPPRPLPHPRRTRDLALTHRAREPPAARLPQAGRRSTRPGHHGLPDPRSTTRPTLRQPLRRPATNGRHGPRLRATPQLILVDEASLGLAPIIVDEIFEFLTNITREGASLLIVDQFVTRALAMAARAYILNRGTIVFTGPPKELLGANIFEQYLGTQPETTTP